MANMDRKGKVYQSRMARMQEEAYVSVEYIDTLCSDAVDPVLYLRKE